ncbi:hypothetical protein GH983_04100 [Agrobacterium sp. MA01]|nr:hypothetical protein GH983_04100 [Agrobacterium sp. MA01]
MKYRLRLTREARQDIDALARYIAERAVQTVALAYVDRLQAFLVATRSDLPSTNAIQGWHDAH